VAYNVRCVCTGEVEERSHEMCVHARAISSPRLPRCARWPGKQSYIHKFIMLSSRTSTELAFFSQNQPKLTAYTILRTVTTLQINIVYVLTLCSDSSVSFTRCIMCFLHLKLLPVLYSVSGCAD